MDYRLQWNGRRFERHPLESDFWYRSQHLRFAAADVREPTQDWLSRATEAMRARPCIIMAIAPVVVRRTYSSDLVLDLECQRLAGRGCFLGSWMDVAQEFGMCSPRRRLGIRPTC